MTYDPDATPNENGKYDYEFEFLTDSGDIKLVKFEAYSKEIAEHQAKEYAERNGLQLY